MIVSGPPKAKRHSIARFGDGNGKSVESSLATVDDAGIIDSPNLSVNGSVCWRGEHITPGKEYDKDDMVRDEGYLMIANTDTSDKPAPHPVGDPFYAYDTDGLVPVNVTSKHVIFGNRYVFGAVTGNSIFMNGWRLFARAGNNYDVWSVTNPGPDEVVKQVVSITANADGWLDAPIAPVLVDPGQVLDIRVIASSSAATETSWSSFWDYVLQNNPGAPSSGKVIHSSKNRELLQVNKVDNNGVDQSSSLLGMGAGDKIDSAGVSWEIQSFVDQGSYVDFVVAPETRAYEGVHEFIFSTVSAEQVTYDKDTDYWASSQYDVHGLYTTGALRDVVADDSAYGVDILVQLSEKSPDWDMLAVSGSASGSSGSVTMGALDDLTDVDTVSSSESDILVKRSDQWVSEIKDTHGQLIGLGDDDHPQYLTDARGDAKYATLSGLSSVTSSLNTHTGDVANPHSVTKGQLGLDNFSSDSTSVSIGANVSATGAGSVAIGTDSTGLGAVSDTDDQIVIGTANQTIVIPGNSVLGPTIIDGRLPDTDWADFVLERGWVPASGGAKYRRLNGIVYLMMTMKDGDTSWGYNGYLPVGFRPPFSISYAGINYGNASCEVKVYTSGGIAFGGSSATLTSFGVSYPVE